MQLDPLGDIPCSLVYLLRRQEIVEVPLDIYYTYRIHAEKLKQIVIYISHTNTHFLLAFYLFNQFLMFHEQTDLRQMLLLLRLLQRQKKRQNAF